MNSINYKLYKDYRDEKWLREEFFDFAHQIFGLAFKEWYEYGCWNDSYICYSLVDRDRMVSNVSLSKFNVTINNEKKKAIQLATVGTLEEYRGKGLSRFLMEKVLDEYQDDNDFVFLSANDTVVDFYPRFGFRRVPEYKFTADLFNINNEKLKNESNKTRIRKLNIDNQEDLAIIKRLFQKRIPLSQRFNIENYISVFMWYIVNFYRESIWYIEDKDIVLVYQVDGQTLEVFDIISPANFDFTEVLTYLELSGVKKMQVYFTPDILNIEVDNEAMIDEEPFFVLGGFPLEGKPFKVPQLAQT
ncbi:MAG: GNAT family N-acetyltransferase [bacterium]